MSKTQLERLAAQVERTLKAMEGQAEPASVKDLNGLYRLMDRLRGERSWSAYEGVGAAARSD